MSERNRRHLLGVGDLTRADTERILDTARGLERSLDRELKKLPTLRGRLVVNLFYESSTRTLSSFELAAKRLSADTMALRASGSSVDKGESLRDTALTLAAYDPDVIVIRHPHIGAPHLVAGATAAHVVRRATCPVLTVRADESAADEGTSAAEWALRRHLDIGFRTTLA